MAKAIQPVSVAGIEFDALLEQEMSYEATVPEYAVESGFAISDAILFGAETLSMTLCVTDTPVTWVTRHGVVPGRADDVCRQLRELYFKRELVEVITSDETYSDMAIESITFAKSPDAGYAREVPITFRKVRKTSAETTTIPASYGKSGGSKKSAGTAKTTAAASSTKNSSSGKLGGGVPASGLYNIYDYFTGGKEEYGKLSVEGVIEKSFNYITG